MLSVLMILMVSLDQTRISFSLIAVSFCVTPGVLLYYRPWKPCNLLNKSLSLRLASNHSHFFEIFRHHRILLAGIEKRSIDGDIIERNMENQMMKESKESKTSKTPDSKAPSIAASITELNEKWSFDTVYYHFSTLTNKYILVAASLLPW